MSLNKPIKITFVLPTLFAGGSERIISYLAQNIDKSQFKVTLLVIGHSADSAYDIKDVNVIFLEKSRVLKGIPLLYKYLKKNKPDIVLSVIGHLNAVMAYLSLFFPKTKFIARESTVVSVDANLFKHTNRNIILNLFSNKRFSIFEKIICQSNDMLVDIKNHYNVNIEKLIVINNPITNEFEVKSDIKTPPLKFITIARFSKEKGVPRILELLSKLVVPFHYTLIGDGPEKDEILKLVKRYNFEKKFTHIPFTKEVQKYLAMNDFFLQGSYVEGFPNALLESCAVGTPVIAFNVPGGTKEIIINGVNGFLVNNESEFIDKLNHTKSWDPLTVRDSVMRRFNKDKIIKQYETLFLDILNENKSG